MWGFDLFVGWAEYVVSIVGEIGSDSGAVCWCKVGEGASWPDLA